MINVTTLILKLSISHFKMVMFLALHPMESNISKLIRFARASSYVTDFKVSKGAKIRNRYNKYHT